MFLIPFAYYNNLVNTYDSIAKNNFISSFQIPQVKLVYVSFTLNFLSLKYILYSLLFLNIITLQKPYLNFGKKIKVNILLKKNSFVGCKVVLRNSNMNSFLNLLIIKMFPLIKMNLLTKKSLNTSKLVPLNMFTFHLNSLSVHYTEIEDFYNYFQYLNNLSITIHLTKKISKFQLLSLLYISTKK